MSVVATGSTAGSVGLWSRYSRAGIVTPDPGDSPAAFVEALEEGVERFRPRVLYPGSEQVIDAIGRVGASDRVMSLLPYPRLDALAALRDKRLLPDAARDAGLLAPRTLASGDSDDLAATVDVPGGVIKAAAPGGAPTYPIFASSRAALRAELAGLPPATPVIVQERGQGALTGLAVVIDECGEIVAHFQQLTTRTWPVMGGVSASAISVAPDLELVGRVRSMLASVGFVGLAHLQFTPTAAGPALIDVNPRYYGSLPLALAAGVNLPAVWHEVVTGGTRLSPGEYRVGMRFRWMEGNLLAAIGGTPRALVDGGRKRAHGVWSADDPLASAAWAGAAVAGRLGKRLPHKKRAGGSFPRPADSQALRVGPSV